MCLLYQEILLGDSVFQCWDNSTRGLDSVNALDFIKTLRRRTSESGSVAIVTLYQAGEDIYDVSRPILTSFYMVFGLLTYISYSTK